MSQTTSGYSYTRPWFDFVFENPDKVGVNETALYCWLVELNNRLGWTERFGITSTECMLACGFRTYKPYKNALDKLVELGFVSIIKKSANQYQCNIIALSKNAKAKLKALDKALPKQSRKHVQSKDHIHLNTETLKHINKSREVVYPNIDEVIQYFKEKGYTESAAKKAFRYYDESGWVDKNGNKVLNWKKKMATVWFKEADLEKNKVTHHPDSGIDSRFVA